MERQKHKSGGSGRAEASLRLADASLAAPGSPRQTAAATSPTSPLSPRSPRSPSSPKSPGNKSLASPASPPRSPQSPTSLSSAASSPTKTTKQTASSTSHLVRSNSSAGAAVKRNRSLRESIIARSRSLYGSNKSPVSPSRAAHGSTPSISQPVLVSGPAMYSEDGGFATAVARPPVPPRASAERILQPGSFISAGEARGLGVRPPLGPPSSSSSHPSSSLYDVPSADASQTSFSSSTTRLPLANVPPMDGVWLDEDSDASDDGTTSPIRTAPGSARRKSKTKTHRRGTSSGMSFASLRSLGSASRRSQTSPGERQGKTTSFMGRLRGNSSPAPPAPGFITKEMISGPSNFVHAGHMDASQLGGRPRPTLNTDLGPDGRPNSRPSPQHHQHSYSHSHIPPKSPQRGAGHFQSASTASVATDYKWRHDSNGSTFSTSASSASNVYSLPSTVSSEQSSPVVPPRSPQRRGHLPAQLLEDVLPAKGVAKQPSAESFASAWAAAGRADDSGAPHGTLQQPWMPVDIPPSPTTVSSTSTGSTMRPVDRKASVLLPSPLFAGNNNDRDANIAVLQPALAHSQSYQRLLGTLGPRVSATPQAPRLVPRAVAEESVLPPEYAHGRAPEWI